MSEFGRQDDPAQQLQRALGRIDNMSNMDMTMFSINHHLEAINRFGRVVEGVGQAAIGPVLKRVLLVKPPFTWEHTFICEQLPDLAYSEAERQATEQAKAAAANRQAAIAQEIADGAEPWLTHVKHNEQDILNPLTIGFYQDDGGKIRALYGPRYFQSKRQIENSIFGGRTEHKEVNLLDGRFTQVQPTEILQGTYWDALPDDLREHFERGEILLTTGNDHYAPTNWDANQVASSEEPDAYIKLVEQNVQESDSSYLLLYYSDYVGEDTGRTAVVMTKSDSGALQPVVVTVGDKEFVVEVKGCGTKAGGFKGMHFRTGRDIITGGAEAAQARTERNRLEDDKRAGAPKAVGSILFDNPNQRVWNPETAHADKPYAQGYIIRLAPSTVRASYTGNEAYPDIEQPKFVDCILQIYTSQLVDHLFSNPPKILNRSSHSENILVWSNGEFTFTDYSDHVAFADKNFPRYDDQSGDVTPKKLLEYYLTMVDEIPGYRNSLDLQKFYGYLSASLEAQGIAVAFDQHDGLEQTVDKIWKGGMAYQVFKGRKDGQYFPEGVLDQFLENFTASLSSQVLPRNSVEAFIESEAQARLDLLETLEFYSANTRLTMPEGIDISEWEHAVRTAPLSELTPIASKISRVYCERDNYNHMSRDQRMWVYGKTGYYGVFDYIVVSRFRDYFEHELDVITAAQQSCSEGARAELAAAEAEVKTRLDRLSHLVDNDLAGLYKAVSTQEAARNMLGFSFYGYSPNRQ